MLPQAIVFAAIAGYADAIGYLRFEAFAGMMTGNTVFLGLAFFNHSQRSAADYAGIIAIFVAAAMLSSTLLRLRRAPLLVVAAEAAMLLLTDASRADWAVIPLVIAMGLQNPLSHHLGVPISTTFITGNLIRFAEGVASHTWPKTGAAAPSVLIITGLVWVGYVTGAALGALGFAHLSAPLLVPLLGLTYIAWRTQRR